MLPGSPGTAEVADTFLKYSLQIPWRRRRGGKQTKKNNKKYLGEEFVTPVVVIVKFNDLMMFLEMVEIRITICLLLGFIVIIITITIIINSINGR
jgi:hypothetical protein